MTRPLDALPAQPPRSPSQHLRRFVGRGLTTAAAALPLTLLFWALSPQPLTSNFVFTLCISISCWFVIDSARIVVAVLKRLTAAGSVELDNLWPGWSWMVPIVIVGSVFGYALGNAGANALLGLHVPGPFDVSPREALALFVVALVPGSVITHVFYSRERIAAQAALVEQAERQAAEQRLKLIESQLDPHMLFNTLANVRALIAIDAPGAQTMLDCLIAFLRASLAGSRTRLHSLDDEMARLADYLALMQVRMGARLQTRFAVSAEAACAAVPTLLLQPLVENSIRHGLEPQVGGGRVELTAVREGDALVVQIRDSGVGLPTHPGPRDGFGLNHVRERLATLYGERAELVVEAAADADGGTLVSVRLPYAAFEAGPAVAAAAVHGTILPPTT